MFSHRTDEAKQPQVKSLLVTYFIVGCELFLV